MKHILCLLGLHDFHKISKVVPTKSDDAFDLLVDGYALGRCRRCGGYSMVKCVGGLEPYKDGDVKTKSQWLKILVKE